MSKHSRLAAGLALLLGTIGVPAVAGTFDGNGDYHGTIQGVAVGFFSNVGVGLTDGATCSGQGVAVLLTSNPQYKDILAVLLAAQSTGSNLRLWYLTGATQTFPGGYTYCVINFASLGDFPLW